MKTLGRISVYKEHLNKNIPLKSIWLVQLPVESIWTANIKANLKLGIRVSDGKYPVGKEFHGCQCSKCI